MLFENRFIAPIKTGAVSLTFRYWRTARVRVGGIYRVFGDVAIRVEAVSVVRRITNADARRSGFDSAAALKAYLTRLKGGDDRALYRIEFVRVPGVIDPRRQLAHGTDDDASLEALRTRLQAMDRRSARGPWTHTVLALIAANPGRRAGDLAVQMDWLLAPFKAHVRRLKALGLTESLEVGYTLTPRARAYLEYAATRRRR